MNLFKQYRLLIFSFCMVHQLNAQIIEYGVNVNYHANKLIVNDSWADDVFMREAPVGSGLGVGLYFSKREPKTFNVNGLDLKFGYLIEADGCICNSNIKVAITRPEGLPNIFELNYRMYRFDFSPKLTIHQRRFGFGFGPKVSRVTFVSFTTNQSDDSFSATRDFPAMSYGVEASVFYDFGGIKVSGRYNRQLTTFQKAILGRPTEINNRQMMLSLSFRLLDRSKGLNHDSIFWD